MIYRDYEIVQNGKLLSCLDKIVINKYDNKTSRFHFTYDGTLEGNFYVALQNPTLNRYFIEPIVDDYYEITSAISLYPGRWEMILIVTDNSYEITDNTFDQSKAVYVSDTFSKVIVKDNFLDEESKDAIDPIQSAAIDSILEELSNAKNTLEVMSQNATDSAQAAENSEIAARNYYEEVSAMYNEIVTIYNDIKRMYNRLHS